MSRLPLVVVLTLLSSVTLAIAQDSRVAVLEQEKAAKAAAVRPYEPDKAEKIFNWAMESFLLAPQGFLPLITSIPKGDNVFHSGGIAGGAMYRGFLGDQAGWSATGLISYPGYTHVDVSADALRLARGRVALRGGAGWTSGARIPFYGVGTGSSQDDLTNFGVEMGYVGAQLRTNPLPWFALGDLPRSRTSRRRQAAARSRQSRPSFPRPPRRGSGRRRGICTPARSRASTGVR